MPAVAHEGNPRSTDVLAVTGTLDGNVFLIINPVMPTQPTTSILPSSTLPDNSKQVGSCDGGITLTNFRVERWAGPSGTTCWPLEGRGLSYPFIDDVGTITLAVTAPCCAAYSVPIFTLTGKTPSGHYTGNVSKLTSPTECLVTPQVQGVVTAYSGNPQFGAMLCTEDSTASDFTGIGALVDPGNLTLRTIRWNHVPLCSGYTVIESGTFTGDIVGGTVFFSFQMPFPNPSDLSTNPAISGSFRTRTLDEDQTALVDLWHTLVRAGFFILPSEGSVTLGTASVGIGGGCVSCT